MGDWAVSFILPNLEFTDIAYDYTSPLKIGLVRENLVHGLVHGHVIVHGLVHGLESLGYHSLLYTSQNRSLIAILLLSEII